MLMKTGAQPLTEQLATRLAQRIRDRLLAPGMRLPSVRHRPHSRHVRWSQQQTPTRRGCAAARLAENHLFGHRRAAKLHGRSAEFFLSAIRRTPGRHGLAPRLVHQAGRHSRAGRARANHHHCGRHPGADNCIAAARPVHLLVARLWET